LFEIGCLNTYKTHINSCDFDGKMIDYIGKSG